MRISVFLPVVLACTLCAGPAFAGPLAPLTWTATTSLPTGLTGHCVVYWNGYVYVLGGRSDASPYAVNTVYYAPVNSNGSLGAWATGTPLPAARTNGGAAVCNGKMYYWGGWDNAVATKNTCYYATINADGSLGAWTTSSVTIPNSPDGDARGDSFGRGVLQFGDKLYILGGEDNSGTQ